MGTGFFWNLRITSVLFADDEVCLGPSKHDFQHALSGFSGECVE